jgi:predicted metal-dependent enzyme (double-stranded beta helix superfamily)
MTLSIAPPALATTIDPTLPRLRRGGPNRLYPLARQLAERTDLWRPQVRFAHERRWSVRVAVTDDYEAWLLTWLPGQSTGLHDHGGSAGAFTVLEGVVEESTLAPSRSRRPAALVHRTLTAGRVRAFGSDYVHDVTNTGEVPAVSLHVYAPALDTMRRYVLDDNGRPQVVSLEQSGTDW